VVWGGGWVFSGSKPGAMHGVMSDKPYGAMGVMRSVVSKFSVVFPPEEATDPWLFSHWDLMRT